MRSFLNKFKPSSCVLACLCKGDRLFIGVRRNDSMVIILMARFSGDKPCPMSMSMAFVYTVHQTSSTYGA